MFVIASCEFVRDSAAAAVLGISDEVVASVAVASAVMAVGVLWACAATADLANDVPGISESSAVECVLGVGLKIGKARFWCIGRLDLVDFLCGLGSLGFFAFFRGFCVSAVEVRFDDLALALSTVEVDVAAAGFWPGPINK